MDLTKQIRKEAEEIEKRIANYLEKEENNYFKGKGNKSTENELIKEKNEICTQINLLNKKMPKFNTQELTDFFNNNIREMFANYKLFTGKTTMGYAISDDFGPTDYYYLHAHAITTYYGFYNIESYNFSDAIKFGSIILLGFESPQHNKNITTPKIYQLFNSNALRGIRYSPNNYEMLNMLVPKEKSSLFKKYPKLKEKLWQFVEMQIIKQQNNVLKNTKKVIEEKQQNIKTSEERLNAEINEIKQKYANDLKEDKEILEKSKTKFKDQKELVIKLNKDKEKNPIVKQVVNRAKLKQLKQNALNLKQEHERKLGEASYRFDDLLEYHLAKELIDLQMKSKFKQNNERIYNLKVDLGLRKSREQIAKEKQEKLIKEQKEQEIRQQKETRKFWENREASLEF